MRGKRKAGSILTNAGNAADLLSTRYIIRWCLNVPTALPLSMKQDTANSAAQKSTRVQRVGSAPYANKNYIMKGVDSCGSESGNELAGAMRLRPEGNETNESLSPLRHGGRPQAERLSRLRYATSDKNSV